MPGEDDTAAIDLKDKEPELEPTAEVPAPKQETRPAGFSLAELKDAADVEDKDLAKVHVTKTTKTGRMAEKIKDGFQSSIGVEDKEAHKAHMLQMIQDKLDKDHDGNIKMDELVSFVEEQLEKQNESKQLKKGLMCAIFMVVVLIIAFVLVTVLTSMSTTKTWVTPDGESASTSASEGEKKIEGNLMTFFDGFSGGNTKEAVATAGAEDLWCTDADAKAFAKFKDIGAFKSRPKLVMITFADEAVLQFEPGTVQYFSTSAKISNFAAGVTLSLLDKHLPFVTYHGGPGGLSMNTEEEVTGITSYKAQQARTAPVLTEICLIQPDAVNVRELSAKHDKDAAELPAPQESTEATRAEVTHLTSAIKGLIRVVQQNPDSITSPQAAISRGRSDDWTLFGCYDVELARQVCERFEKGDGFKGKCGMWDWGEFPERFGNLTAGIAGAGTIPVFAEVPQLDLFREAMRDEGNPCHFTAVQKNYKLTTESLHGVSRYAVPFKHSDPQVENPNEEHAELQRSVRRLIADTPGGREMAARQTAELLASQVAELGTEEHRRRVLSSMAEAAAESELGTEGSRRLADADPLNLQTEGWRKQDTKEPSMAWFKIELVGPDAHKTCYRADKPGAYSGTGLDAKTCWTSPTYSPTDYETLSGCGDEGNTCVKWDVAANSPSCRALLKAESAEPNVAPVWSGGKWKAKYAQGDWEPILKLRPLTTEQKERCLCEMAGGTVKSDEERKATSSSTKVAAFGAGSHPRAICNLPSQWGAPDLSKSPWCFYFAFAGNKKEYNAGVTDSVTLKFGGKSNVVLVPAPGKVDPCYAGYYKIARTMYDSCSPASYVRAACSYSLSAYGTETPFIRDFPYHLARLAGKDKGTLAGVYGGAGAVVKNSKDKQDVVDAYDDDLTYQGKDIHIFVIDTGLNYRHKAFNGILGDGFSLWGNWSGVNNPPCSADKGGCECIPAGSGKPSSPSATNPAARPKCTNSCRTKRNGVCEDGGPFATANSCPFGSDCEDCGERTSMDWCQDDAIGHGTHVGGTIVGKKWGIARKSIIHPVKILDQRGKPGISTSNMDTAVQWIIKRMEKYKKGKGCKCIGNLRSCNQPKACATHGIVVFSVGLGGSAGKDGSPMPTFDNIMKQLLENDISFTTSAGNVFADSCTYSPNPLVQIRQSGKTNGLGMVVAGGTNADDSHGWYSNWGACITVWAPGTNIIAPDTFRPERDGTPRPSSWKPPAAGGGWAGRRLAGGAVFAVPDKVPGETGAWVNPEDYVAMTGTSMANPVTAGVMTLGAEYLIATVGFVTPKSLEQWLVKESLRGQVKGLNPTRDIPQWALDNIRSYSGWQYNDRGAYEFLFNPSAFGPGVTGSGSWGMTGRNTQVNKLAHIPAKFFTSNVGRRLSDDAKRLPQDFVNAVRRARALQLAHQETAGGGEALHDPVGAAIVGALQEQHAAGTLGDDVHPRIRRMLSAMAAPEPRRLNDANEEAGSGEDVPAPSPPVCNTTEEAVDEAMTCPPVTEPVCGSPTGKAPDGTDIKRPFQRVKTVCVPGCECPGNSDVGAVKYESCGSCDYTFTNEPCRNVFSIKSTTVAEQASGLTLTYKPLAGGNGFNDPITETGTALDEKFATGTGGTYTEAVQNEVETFSYTKPRKLDMGDSDIKLISVPMSSSGIASAITFQGELYDTIQAACDGYVAFGSPLVETTTETTVDAVFSAKKGSSFMLMQQDIKVCHMYISDVEKHVDLKDGTTQTVPWATVVTIHKAELAFSDKAAPTGSNNPFHKVTASAQAYFEHASGVIKLTLADLPRTVNTVVGPTTGKEEGDARTIYEMGKFLNGEYPASNAGPDPDCN